MTRNTLRIGIVLDSLVPSAWIAKLVTDLQSTHCASVQAVLLIQTPSAQKYSFLFQLYERWDYKRNKAAHDSLKPCDLTEALSGIPCIAVRPHSGTPPEDISLLAKISALQLDVILRLTQSTLLDLSSTTRFGEWSFCFGTWQDDQPSFFRQLFRRSPVVPSAIHIALSDVRRVAYQSQTATDPASLYRTRNPVYWKSAEAALRALFHLHQSSAKYLDSLPLVSFNASPRYEKQSLNSFTMLRFYAQEMSRWLKARAASRRYSERPKWCIWIRPRTLDRTFNDPAGYSMMPSPKDRFYADPFFFEHNGKTFLFFEDFRYAEGRALISCCEIDPNGNPGIPVEVLRRLYHLSYPFIFEEASEIYMIPETRENQAIELYRATNFPLEWTQEPNLISNITAVDATIQRIHGKLWMFTGVSNGAYSNSDELAIFFADTLKGPWMPHPQNPVVSDVQRARPAGLVFSEAGRLIRPSQDCGKAYGYATVFSEIVTLTETDYEERLIGRILPETIPHAISTHTYNRTEHFEVVDRTFPAHIANGHS